MLSDTSLHAVWESEFLGLFAKYEGQYAGWIDKCKRN